VPFTLAQVKGFYAAAAAGPGATQVLVTANANLPAAYPNPGESAGFFIPDAEYKALTGAALDSDPIDGFTGYATNFCGGGTCPYDFTGGAPAANAIDFTAVVEHELSHALSRVDFGFSFGVQGDPPPFLTPQDFFKYDCGTGNLDPKFNVTCFSFNGAQRTRREGHSRTSPTAAIGSTPTTIPITPLSVRASPPRSALPTSS
jgi:hypothetical protein